jgi:hypothetical protein
MLDEQITPTPAEPAKVVFDDAQKARIQDIIRESSATAGREARLEVARLQAELATAKLQAPTADDTVLRLATANAELVSLRTEKQEAGIQDALRAATGGNLFLDAELAAQLLRGSVKLISGKPTPVDSDGNPRLNAAFNQMTVTELAQELAASKPFLARGTTVSGTGSIPSQGIRSHETTPIEAIFGRTSDGPTAHRLSINNPREYARLRTIARGKGLIP